MNPSAPPRIAPPHSRSRLKRGAVAGTLLLADLLLRPAGVRAGCGPQPDGSNIPCGSSFLVSTPPLEDQIPDAVRLSYRIRFDANLGPADPVGSSWKLVFCWVNFHTPGGGNPQSIQFQATNGRPLYNRPQCATGYAGSILYETGFGAGVTDHYFGGQIGARLVEPADSLVLNSYEVDAINGLWQISGWSMRPLNGIELAVEITREGTTTDTAGWNCPDTFTLTDGLYRIWRVAWSDGSFTNATRFLLPESSARYIRPGDAVVLATENFTSLNPGYTRVTFHDFEVESEGGARRSLDSWRVTAEDQNETYSGWGFRKTCVDGAPAIEVSNDGSPDYLRVNDSLSLAASDGCPPDFQPRLSVEWLPATGSVRIEWPVRAFDFDLLTTAGGGLMPDAWQPVAVVPEISGRTLQTELTASEAAAFLMLRQPGTE
ncbi:MAG: hypothetical protein H7A46_03910 [Verrucomicrobiales bacterium]|nr:hypothetical protein [Verrucomicrobiales bacterium]